MPGKRDLKAFVRYDGTGRVIPGSLILQRNKPKVGNWQEINAYECCNPSNIQALRLTFDDIENANLLVGDASSVNDWNTFFNLPINGTPFTSVEIVDTEVRLFGGSNITLQNSIFNNNQHLISIVDGLGCVVSSSGYSFSNNTVITTIDLPKLLDTGYDSFAYGCSSLTTVNIPKATYLSISCFEECLSLTTVNCVAVITTGNSCFGNCVSLMSIDLRNATDIAAYSFYGCTSLTSVNLGSCTNLGGTINDDGVFGIISGNVIILKVPSILMTCNLGDPDGDIQTLQGSNTVTIITI